MAKTEHKPVREPVSYTHLIDPHGKYQVVRWFGNRSVRMIAIDMEALQNPPDPAGFREITDKDDLPF